MADERTRYSDAELEEFKQLILKKLENARADYELLRATITHTADNDTEDTSPTFKVLEEGAATLSKEESGRLAAHQMKFIRNLEMALVRIENKTYGICKTTGKLIPKERLMKVPHATECIEAKEGRRYTCNPDMTEKRRLSGSSFLFGPGRLSRHMPADRQPLCQPQRLLDRQSSQQPQ